MKSNFAFLAGFLFLISCKNFQAVQLAPPTEAVNPNKVLGKLTSSNILLINQGVLEDFNDDHHDWKKSSDSLKVITLGGFLTITNQSSSSEDHVSKLYFPIDFSKSSAIQIDYKADSISPIPLRLALVDEQENIHILFPFQWQKKSLIFPLNLREIPGYFQLNRVVQVLIIPGNIGYPLRGKLYIDQIKALE
jgi:hypothetical protein